MSLQLTPTGYSKLISSRIGRETPFWCELTEDEKQKLKEFTKNYQRINDKT